MTQPQDLTGKATLTVIVIGLNEADNLDRCFRSIGSAISAADAQIGMAQTLYVDSGSTDDSVSIAKRYADRVFRITQNPSAAKARNIGIANSSGELLMFLDGDMKLDDQWFVRTIPLLAGTPNESDGVIGIRNDIFLGGNPPSVLSTRQNYYKVHRKRWAPRIGGALFASRRAIETAGGYPTELKAWEEPDLHARLTKNGFRILELPIEFIDHFTPDRSSPSDVGKRLFGRRGTAYTFGEWFSKARRDGYLVQFFKVNRSVTLLLFGDAISLVGVAAGRRSSAVIAQLLTHAFISRSEGLRFIVLGRLWIIGILWSMVRQNGGEPVAIPQLPEYEEIDPGAEGIF